MRETKRDKALRLLSEDKVTVLLASEHGIRLSIVGSKREPYIVRYGRHDGTLITECSCENAEYHPVRPTCAHVEVARMLWRE